MTQLQTMKFQTKRCKHGFIKKFNDCADCSKDKRVIRITKTLNKSKRKYTRTSNGQFTYPAITGIKNAIAVGFGVGLMVFSGMGLVMTPTEILANDFISPESTLATPGAGIFPTPTPDPIEQEIRNVFGEEADNAIKVFSCESGLKSKCNDGLNKDGSVDCGVPQVNSIHGVSRKWLLNYKIAIQVAKQLYDESGWRPWISSYKCHGVK